MVGPEEKGHKVRRTQHLETTNAINERIIQRSSLLIVNVSSEFDKASEKVRRTDKCSKICGIVNQTQGYATLRTTGTESRRSYWVRNTDKKKNMNFKSHFTCLIRNSLMWHKKYIPPWHTHTPIGNVPVFEAENGLSGALSKFSSENGIGHWAESSSPVRRRRNSAVIFLSLYFLQAS